MATADCHVLYLSRRDFTAGANLRRVSRPGPFRRREDAGDLHDAHHTLTGDIPQWLNDSCGGAGAGCLWGDGSRATTHRIARTI